MENIINNVIQKMINYFGNDVRRINHALKVHSFSKTIGLKENISENKLFVLELSAILHDIGIKISEEKHSCSSGKYQKIEGPAVAEELLKDEIINEENINRTKFLIGNHHTYKKIDDVDFQILIEADFLVNIYEDEMSEENIKSLRDKYFKTQTGIKLINSLYLQ